MQKIKNFNWSSVISIIKCCLLGLIVTLIGTVLLAVILKFADLNSTIICYINDVVKVVAVFIMVLCIKKNSPEKLLIKSIFAGILYAVLTFVIFSILNGGLAFNLGFVYDLLFAVIVAMIASVILNILNRKAM